MLCTVRVLALYPQCMESYKSGNVTTERTNGPLTTIRWCQSCCISFTSTRMGYIHMFWIISTAGLTCTNYTSAYQGTTDMVVSRCEGQSFDTILCDLDTTIEVTGVEQSTINGPDGCLHGATDCTEKLRSSYYEEVKTACDGKVACAGLTAKRQHGNCYVRYTTDSLRTTIHYRCQRRTEVIQSLVKCAPDDFDILLCPVGSEIHLLDLYDVRSSRQTNGTCPATASVGDCVRRLEHKFNDFKEMCNGKLSCKGSDVFHSEVTCAEGNFSSRYFLLVYICTDSNKAINTVTKCRGEHFDSGMCSNNSSLRLLDVYGGRLTDRGPGGCQSSLYDCVSRLSDIKMYSYFCENQTGCTGLRAGQEYVICDGSKSYRKSNYTLLVYTCEGADTGHHKDHSIGALPQLSTMKPVSDGDSVTHNDSSDPSPLHLGKSDVVPGFAIGLTVGVIASVLLAVVVVFMVCIKRRRDQRKSGNQDVIVSSEIARQDCEAEYAEIDDVGSDVTAAAVYCKATEIELNDQTTLKNNLMSTMVTNINPHKVSRSNIYSEVTVDDSEGGVGDGQCVRKSVTNVDCGRNEVGKDARPNKSNNRTMKENKGTAATASSYDEVDPSIYGLARTDDEGTFLVENRIFDESVEFDTHPSDSPN